MAEDNKKEDNLTGLDQFSLDKIGGVKMGGIQPKTIDTGVIDKQIAALEKPAGGSVYDKMAARYRSQGEGAVLRTQKNLANLFSPTINLIQEREAAAQNRFTLLKDKLPEFDDSTIFGHQSGNPMPIVEEIKNISKITKEDMRMLSRLNVNDKRYDEIRKRIEKNQDAIVAFDAINEKLLEIRNSQDGREDDSQWSRGMDPTTRKMWEDIYASNGQNIKIQDGKLVWTSTGVNVGYDISGDTKQDLLRTDSSLGIMHQIRNKYDYEGGMEYLKKNKEDVKTIQKKLLELYPKTNLGTTGDNSDGVDGNWGDLTQAAYSKYFRNKSKLEQKFYDKNLTYEEKKKFGITTRVGETRVIDLNEIGDGPTMIDNIGITKDTEVQGAIQELINNNVTVNTPGYESQVNALIRTINSVGPKGIKSLIFDGFGAQQGDVLKSTNTDSFIKQIIQNNPKEFGIKDVENLTQEEIANAYDIMRSRDVTYSYSNELGESQTLQSQYLQWYKKEIDAKVEAGITVESTLVDTKDTEKIKKKESTSNFSEDIGGADGTEVNSSIVLPTFQMPKDNKETSYDNAELVFEDGIPYIKLDSDNKQSFDGNPTGLINFLAKLYPDADRNAIKDYVNGQVDASKALMEEAKNPTTKPEILNKIDKITKTGSRIGGRGYAKGTIFKYGGEHVINNLNQEYGYLGFTFKDTGVVQDVIEIEFKKPNGDIIKYSNADYPDGYDNMTDSADNNTARYVKKWMQSMITSYYR